MKSIRATLDSLSIRELVNSVRSVYAASAHRDVLAGINTSLVLFDQILINTASGEYRQILEDSEGKTRVEQIAKSAKQLLEGREQNTSILLLLPPADFIATRFTMGISGEKLLRSALMLQVHSLVPAYDEPLLLGLNGGSSDGVALWYPARNAEALFMAFREHGLFLATLMPRSLALLQTPAASEDCLLIDEDTQHVTQLECRSGIIKSLLSINQIDLQQEEFTAQWNAECSKVAEATRVRSNGQEDWIGLRQVFHAVESYSFFPAGAEQVGRKLISKQLDPDCDSRISSGNLARRFYRGTPKPGSGLRNGRTVGSGAGIPAPGRRTDFVVAERAYRKFIIIVHHRQRCYRYRWFCAGSSCAHRTTRGT
jgi:hypothetical protein